MEEGFVNVVPPLVAYRQPAVTGEPCQRALHHPPVLSQFLAGVDPPAGDARGYAPLPERSAASREVVGFVCVQLRRTLARPTGKSTGPLDRLYSVHGFFEDLRVVDVCSREHYGERDAPSVRNNVALRARFSFIRRIRAGLRSPLFAGTLAESKEARSHSMRSAWPRRFKSARCSSSHTPPSCQSRSLRQHVEPDPHPISLGSISQGMPLFRTKMMPARASRSGTRGRPPLGLGGSSGSRGSIASQSSSLTSSLLMPTSVPSTHQQVLQGTLSVVRYRAGQPAVDGPCAVLPLKACANFGEFPFRNCLENRDVARNRCSGSRKDGPKGPRSAAFCRPRSTLARLSAIFQTVSPRTSVNSSQQWPKGRLSLSPNLASENNPNPPRVLLEGGPGGRRRTRIFS